ncbi:MAG TPA: ROK family transcriptional regulator [Terracidiphilus sp.]|nr:ROK family transcriptional regulator [Terracidiphilus sp.]HUX28066.1 ROK family transcriptional regulator [Terracidiphilus sp.]
MTEKPNRVRRGVASSETAREINRDIILHAIHRHQPVSRADLARLTGLQPSTVSVIIGLLIDEGWVLPGTLGRLPRGRRPTFVTLNDRHVTLAIDLRPGNASLAVIDINGKILSRESVVLGAQSSSKAEVQQVILKIATAARSLRDRFTERQFAGVGVSVSGRVDQKTYKVLFSPNVPWMQIDLHGELQRVLESEIELDNAANACLFAERWFGDFGEASNMIVVGVSDGIGTGLLVDGRLVRGKGDMAGEFGHMPLEESDVVCGCGGTGCWETFASNRAGLRYYRELAPESAVGSFKELMELAMGGDLRALRSIDKMMTYLARGITILVAGLAPEVVIIVGDCTALWPRIYPILESQLIAKSFTSNMPRLVAAMDGDLARLRGAAALVLHKVLFRRAEFEQLDQQRAERPGVRGSLME